MSQDLGSSFCSLRVLSAGQFLRPKTTAPSKATCWGWSCTSKKHVRWRKVHTRQSICGMVFTGRERHFCRTVGQQSRGKGPGAQGLGCATLGSSSCHGLDLKHLLRALGVWKPQDRGTLCSAVDLSTDDSDS